MKIYTVLGSVLLIIWMCGFVSAQYIYEGEKNYILLQFYVLIILYVL